MSASDPVIPGLATARQRERAESLLVTAYRSGITDAKELANFMGQTQHESQNFSRLEENLNYRGSVLWDTFKGGGKLLPRNGLTEKEAGELAAIEDPHQRRQAIANKIYGGEWGEAALGNTEPDDGYKYRGRGYIQLTGRDNYANYQRKTGLELVNQPDLAANPGNAETLAVQYWKDNVQPKTSDRGSVTDAGSIINTGRVGRAVKGLEDRQANASAWEAALDKGYLQDALYRRPEAVAQLSDTSRELLRDSERHVRALADKHKLPWDRGMDNTVFAVAQHAREQGMTDITALKVVNGQIRFAQQAKGEPLRETQIDAKVAANTGVDQSVGRMVQADQPPVRNAAAPATSEPARTQEPALAH
jgi:putative chitinase